MKKRARGRRSPLWMAWIPAVAGLVFAGCAGSEDADSLPTLLGEVVEVIPERNVVVVKHEDVGQVLPAGTGEFRVSSGDLANAEVGRPIRARLVEHDGEYSLERIWPMDRMSLGIIDKGDRRLMEDTILRGSQKFREVGELLPAFALFDQTGKVVQVDRYKGRRLVINFIYTRCPIPEMCPAATQRMIQLQEAAKEAGIENFELVSITLDPDYDTPGVLREYAERHHIDTSNFSFLTGPDRAIANLMGQFGILIDPEVGFESHTLGTMLVDESGEIRHRVFGSNWMVGDFLDRLKAMDAAERDEGA